MAKLDIRKHRCHRPLHDSGPAWVQQFPLLESRGDAQHSYTTTQRAPVGSFALFTGCRRNWSCLSALSGGTNPAWLLPVFTAQFSPLPQTHSQTGLVVFISPESVPGLSLLWRLPASGTQGFKESLERKSVAFIFYLLLNLFISIFETMKKILSHFVKKISLNQDFKNNSKLIRLNFA